MEKSAPIFHRTPMTLKGILKDVGGDSLHIADFIASSANIEQCTVSILAHTHTTDSKGHHFVAVTVRNRSNEINGKDITYI